MSNGIYHGNDTLDTGQVYHLPSDDVDGQIASRAAGETDDEITDGAALAIASWRRAPDGPGLAFAQLASTGRVRLEDLADSISNVYDTLIASDPDRRYMDYLATWALNHQSRTEGSAPSTDVITWADGFGVWHVRVPRQGNPFRTARRALRDEITLRESRPAREVWMWPERVPSEDATDTIVYREGRSGWAL